MKEIKLHIKLTKKITMEKNTLASHAGSGIIDVYATPMMTALAEDIAAACLSQFLEEGETSVDIMMRATHDAAIPADMMVTTGMEITAVGRKEVSFHIIAGDGRDLIDTIDHNRLTVKREALEAGALSRLENSRIHM